MCVAVMLLLLNGYFGPTKEPRRHSHLYTRSLIHTQMRVHLLQIILPLLLLLVKKKMHSAFVRLHRPSTSIAETISLRSAERCISGDRSGYITKTNSTPHGCNAVCRWLIVPDQINCRHWRSLSQTASPPSEYSAGLRTNQLTRQTQHCRSI